LARISLELTKASNEMSGAMKKLSAVATLLLPLTLIAGLWGMNVPVPGHDSDSLYWFLGISLSFLLFAVILVGLFKV